MWTLTERLHVALEPKILERLGGRGGAREKRQQPELLWVRWVCGRTGPRGQSHEK